MNHALMHGPVHKRRIFQRHAIGNASAKLWIQEAGRDAEKTAELYKMERRGAICFGNTAQCGHGKQRTLQLVKAPAIDTYKYAVMQPHGSSTSSQHKIACKSLN